jgi:hypothetical protein
MPHGALGCLQSPCSGRWGHRYGFILNMRSCLILDDKEAVARFKDLQGHAANRTKGIVMSEHMVQHFKQLYESMDTEKLIDLQRKGTLRPEAEEILNAVLEARGLTVVQRNSIVAELEAASGEHRVRHLAPIGDRIMARLIDTAICFAIAATVGFVVLHVPETAFHPAYLLFVPASFLGYLLLADSMANGQSFGKSGMGSR